MRPLRRPRHIGVVALTGVVVGAALYPLTFVLAQVLAGSCRRRGLNSLASCLIGGLSSLVLAGVILTVVAATVLRLAHVPWGPALAALSFATAALLAWRLVYVWVDLQAVLGRGSLWLGVIALPPIYLGWFLVLTRSPGRLAAGAWTAGGALLLVVGFVAPAAVEGSDHRQFLAEQRRWLVSLPFTVYEPVEPLPGFALRGAEGRFNSRPQIRLRYRAPERSLEVLESLPYPAFAPPGSCGLGFPSDSVPVAPCRAVGTLPGGEPIWFRFQSFSHQLVYAAQIGSTVITMTTPAGNGPADTPDQAIIRMLQSLRPVPAPALADRLF